MDFRWTSSRTADCGSFLSFWSRLRTSECHALWQNSSSCLTRRLSRGWSSYSAVLPRLRWHAMAGRPRLSTAMFTVTAHFMSDRWKIISCVTQCASFEGGHTGERPHVATLMHDVMMKFKVKYDKYAQSHTAVTLWLAYILVTEKRVTWQCLLQLVCVVDIGDI